MCIGIRLKYLWLAATSPSFRLYFKGCKVMIRRCCRDWSERRSVHKFYLNNLSHGIPGTECTLLFFPYAVRVLLTHPERQHNAGRRVCSRGFSPDVSWSYSRAHFSRYSVHCIRLDGLSHLFCSMITGVSDGLDGKKVPLLQIFRSVSHARWSVTSVL
jgi:hypothetical protein